MQRDLSKFRINLEKAAVLLVDENLSSLDLLSTIVTGFGFGERLRASSAHAAMDVVKERNVDLILIEAQLSKMDGYDFIHWLRRSGLKPNAFTPTILVAGHTPRDKVEKARDCGANYIVAKPLTPLVLLERIVFVSRDRPFVECASYVGPDRRIKDDGPPPGTSGRRRTDLPDLDYASSRNLSQSEIDILIKPTKVRP
jgi:DNA-binding response OmpR family regulator